MKYTHIDAQGMRWRFAGSRPVSELADQLMKEVARTPRTGLKPIKRSRARKKK